MQNDIPITPTTNVGQFLGAYKLKWGNGGIGALQAGYKVYIGTGDHFAPPPRLVDVGDGTYATQVGVSIFSVGQDGAEALLLPQQDAAWFTYQEGTLVFSGEIEFQGRLQPLWMQISLFEVPFPDEPYKGIHFMVTGGDPEQVGAWGADDDSDD
ncbi:MAG: hypothetical protein AAF657_14245 [Acidobacteriota bacterium]